MIPLLFLCFGIYHRVPGHGSRVNCISHYLLLLLTYKDACLYNGYFNYENPPHDYPLM